MPEMEPTRESVITKGFRTFEKVTLPKGRRLKSLHDEACFLFLLNGSFKVRTPVKTLALSGNDGMISKCGDYFYEDETPNDQLVEIVGIYFHPPIVKELFSLSEIQNIQNSYLAHPVKPHELLNFFKQNLLYYFDNLHLFDEEMQLHKIKELLLILSKTEKAPSVHHFIASLFATDEYQFKDVITSNLYASLSMAELATLCGMSLASFKRKFGEYYDMAPGAYIRTQKLEKAAQLLGQKNYRVNEIAYDCGFESVATFNRLFKKHFGQSPSKFKMSQIEQ